MKTGTLSNVVALAGYVPDATGKPLVVVAMVNSQLAGNGRGRAVLDTLIDWVARLGGPAQPLLLVPGQPAPSQSTPAPEPSPQGVLATPPAQPAQPLQPAQPQTQPQPQQGQDGMQRQPVQPMQPAPSMPPAPAMQPAGAGR
jgi:D-alanyl-D-alanine carboxypeptidase/D-alanyl-D-alanine-endopeptidase (penicillin-binding protein 4)